MPDTTLQDKYTRKIGERYAKHEDVYLTHRINIYILYMSMLNRYMDRVIEGGQDA